MELLAPFFQKMPHVFGGLADALQQLYLDACLKTGREPDGDLLAKFKKS